MGNSLCKSHSIALKQAFGYNLIRVHPIFKTKLKTIRKYICDISLHFSHLINKTSVLCIGYEYNLSYIISVYDIYLF